ncbi:MAG: DUF1570 domain-containing protein [Victivallales bacterium]|jgi:hypothetical protein
MKLQLKILSAAILALILIYSVHAETKPYAKIGREEIISAEGMKIRLFKDAIPKPVPPVSAEKLISGTGEKIEAYVPEELWIHDQYVGSWGSDQGMISIFKITLPAPSGLKRVFRNLVLKADYDDWKKGVKPEWDEKTVAEWMRCFRGDRVKNTAGEAVLKDIPKKNRITRYDSEDIPGRPHRQFYLVESADRPNDKYLLAYELSRDADTGKSEDAIRQSLQSISFFTPKPAEAKPAPSARAAARGRDYSQAYLESKERVIQSIRSLKGWKYYETDNFILVTNIDNRKTLSDLQTNLERSRSAFEKFYPLKIPLRAVSVCKIFETREEYLSYVGGAMKWSAGMWMADKKELVISPMASGSMSDNRRIMTDIAFHEGFHQYIFYAADEVTSDVWFNEGNACFFEGIDFKSGDKVKIDLTNRVEGMKRISSSGIRLENFINLDYQDFYSSANLDQNYSLAWGLMFFLQKGAPVLKGKNNYSEIPSKYYEALIETKDGRRATKIAWSGVDMVKFGRDFADFWRNDALIRRAEAYDPLDSRGRNANR